TGVQKRALPIWPRPTASRWPSTTSRWRRRWPPPSGPTASRRRRRKATSPARRCIEPASARAHAPAWKCEGPAYAGPSRVTPVVAGSALRSRCLFRRGRGRGRSLPATGLALVLLLQPLLQRGEVLQHRAAVDLLAAGQLLERGLPGLAGAAREHGPELPAGLGV